MDSKGKLEIAVDQAGPKQCLLKAALRIFAKNGFHGASVREICKSAGANVGSVNYHFHGKEKLYKAVLECATQRLDAQFSTGATRFIGRLRIQKRLDEIQPLFSCFMLEEDSVRLARLMVRELMEQGPAFDRVVAALRTCATRLEEELRKLPGARTELELVQLRAINLVCQYLLSCVLQPAIHRLYPELRKRNNSKQFVARITRSTVTA